MHDVVPHLLIKDMRLSAVRVMHHDDRPYLDQGIENSERADCVKGAPTCIAVPARPRIADRKSGSDKTSETGRWKRIDMPSLASWLSAIACRAGAVSCDAQPTS